MSKQKKENNLLAGGVITDEAMEAYLNGTLSAAERAQFDKLLADDPFAQDALEGMQAAPDRAAAQTRIAGIKKKIRTQTGGREHKTIAMHWVNYVWAAVVLGMLVGIGFLMVSYLNKNTDESIAQNEAPQEILTTDKQEEVGAVTVQADTTTALTIDSARLNGAVSGTYAVADTVSFNSYYDATNVATASNNIPAGKPASKTTVPVRVDEKGNVAQGNSSTLYKDELSKTKRAEQLKADVGEVEASKMVADDKAGSKQEAKLKAAAPKVEDTKAGSGGAGSKAVPTQAEAMQNFNAGRYKESSEQFEAILKSQPSNADAQYFGGVSDYLNGNLNKSEKQFDKLLKSGNRYTEGSKWYKANILIKKGKKEEAKKILQDLSNTNNSYKERATNKLKEL